MINTKKIGEYCVVGDGAHASIARMDNGIPYLTSKNFGSSGIKLDKVDYISKSDFNKYFRENSKALTKPKIGDLIFSIIGSMGGAHLYKKTDNFGLSSSVAIIRPDSNTLDSKYLLYYLKSEYLQKWVESIKSGSAQGFLSLEMIRNLPLILPELNIQQKIASILSAYDDLIENNNQRIQLLEKMASEIYKEWFVRFRFPGYENVVFRDKDGKEVDRESDGALPDGWKKEQLREHINFYRGKSYSSAELRDNEGLAMINLKNIQRQGGFRLDGLKYFEGKYNLNNEAYSGDIVMAVTDMTQEREIVGRVALVPDMGIEKFIISMDLIRIEPISLPKLYLYCFFRYSGIGLQLKEFANGANVLHLTPSLIEFQKAVIPPAAICEKFEELIKPMLSEIDVLNNKNQVLQETRDLLLPRLISGKLSVEHLLDETYEPKEAIRTAAEPTAVYETKSIK